MDELSDRPATARAEVASKQTMVQQLAGFAAGAGFSMLSEAAQRTLKLRILDAVGCALGALGSQVLDAVRAEVDEMGGRRLCTLIGGGRTAPDRAAFFNGAAVRYLDFNDSYLAPKETCHPSDNLAPVLAAAEYADADGKELLTALAVAYQVQCRLSDVAPVRAHGFDHVTQGAYAAAAGVARALGLDAAPTAHAIAIAGTAYNALRVTRTGSLSNWKGLAFPNVAFGAMHAAMLARHGITGPAEVFEGNKGFMEAIAGPFEIDWSRENLEKVTETVVKRYNAEIHSQSTLEAVLELRADGAIDPANVARVEVDVFDVAYNIIGGGEEGGKKLIRTKEEADHSIPYLVAVALLDGQVLPAQFDAERIQRDDVQDLLQRVDVHSDSDLSARFPEEHGCRVRIFLRDGRMLARDKREYLGFRTRPMGWIETLDKFHQLADHVAGKRLADQIASSIRRLDEIRATDLGRLLGRVRRPGGDTEERYERAARIRVPAHEQAPGEGPDPGRDRDPGTLLQRRRKTLPGGPFRELRRLRRHS
jgi:2-methylcitrate dehydratase